MSSALREVFAIFGVEFDAKELEEGNKKIEESKKKLRELGEVVLEAFAVEKIAEFTLGLAEQAEQLEHTSQATGLSTDELQAWRFGARKAGIENEEFTGALRRLSLALAGGKNEIGTQSALLTKLGATTSGAAGHTQTLSDVLPKIAEEFKNMADGPKKAAEASALFGRQGARLIPLLNKGAAGIAELKKELQELGGGFSPEFIEESSKLIEQTKRLDLSWTSLKVRIAGYLVPAVDSVVNGLIRFTSWAGKLADQTNVVTAAMVVFGARATYAVLKIAAANAPLLAEFALMAVGIGLAVLAIDELITTWQGGDSLITRGLDKLFGKGATAKAVAWIKSVGDAFAEMFGDATNDTETFHDTWQRTIADIQSDTDGFGGYWKASFLAAMTDAFFATVNGLSNGWEVFGNFMAGMIEGLGFSFEVVWDDIKYAGLSVAAALSDAFDSFLSHLGPIKDLAGKLGIDLSGNGGHAGADIDADRAANTKRRVAEGEDILAKVQGTGRYAPKPRSAEVPAEGGAPARGAPGESGGGGDTNVHVHAPVNVHVHGGATPQAARQVGQVTAHAASGAHRKAAAALGQGAG